MNGRPSYAPGQVVVMFQPETAIEEVRKVVNEKGLRIIDETPRKRGHCVLIAVPEGSEQEWIDYFRRLLSVRYAELNFYRHLC